MILSHISQSLQCKTCNPNPPDGGGHVFQRNMYPKHLFCCCNPEHMHHQLPQGMSCHLEVLRQWRSVDDREKSDSNEVEAPVF